MENHSARLSACDCVSVVLLRVFMKQATSQVILVPAPRWGLGVEDGAQSACWRGEGTEENWAKGALVQYGSTVHQRPGSH